MSERLNLKISIMGASQNKCHNPLTFDESLKRIKEKGYQPDIENGLVSLLKKQPRNTYELFFKNIYTHLRKLEKNEKNN